MKAWRFHGFGDMRLDDVPEPACPPGHVLVEPLCQSERSNLCRKGPVIGFDLPGCFAERAVLPEIALVKVDDRISDSEAACLQSLSDSVAAVETAQLQVGDSVVILGQGSMGLECLQVARLCGAGLVITVDVRDEACAMSRE